MIIISEHQIYSPARYLQVNLLRIYVIFPKIEKK